MTLEKDIHFLPLQAQMNFIASHKYKQALEKGMDKKNGIKIPKGTKGECIDVLVDKHGENKTVNVLFMLKFEEYNITDYVSPDDVIEKI